MTLLKDLTRLKSSSFKLPRSLIVVGMLFLSACGTVSSNPIPLECPPYPVAGAAVFEELKTLDPDAFPALEEWLGRIDKMAEQTEIQQ